MSRRPSNAGNWTPPFTESGQDHGFEVVRLSPPRPGASVRAPPHVVPTVSGEVTFAVLRLDVQGNLALVGGSESAFFEPGRHVVDGRVASRLAARGTEALSSVSNDDEGCAPMRSHPLSALTSSDHGTSDGETG